MLLLSHKKPLVRACAFEDDEGGQGRGELLFIATVSLGACRARRDHVRLHQTARVRLYTARRAATGGITRMGASSN